MHPLEEPKISFPIRMSKDLHNQFNDISESSLVPKSKLARHAITLFIDEVNNKGLSAVISNINKREFK
jgi:hypothetical protein